jgi:hypothetical protein
MNKLLLCVAPVTLAVALVTPASAQDEQAMQPPAVIRILREDVKQGREMAHEKTESLFTQRLTKAKFPTQYLAADTITGPQQFWVIEAYASFADVAKTRKTIMQNSGLANDLEMLDAQDGELRADSRDMLAVLRPDLSYKTEGAAKDLPKMRIFDVTILHVRPGHSGEFLQAAKMAIAAEEKSAGERPVLTYQVISGDRVGTYMIFRALKSVEDLDASMEREKAFAAAIEDRGKFSQLVGEAISSEDNLLLSFNPKLSYVSREFASADPDYWTPKPGKSAGAKPASKDMNKSAGGQ